MYAVPRLSFDLEAFQNQLVSQVFPGDVIAFQAQNTLINDYDARKKMMYSVWSPDHHTFTRDVNVAFVLARIEPHDVECGDVVVLADEVAIVCRFVQVQRKHSRHFKHDDIAYVTAHKSNLVLVMRE